MDENQMKEIEEMEDKVDHSYTADDIQVLEGLEAVRETTWYVYRFYQ